ncbi:guanylate kinase [Nocardia uniformis]|uniref:Guanylate kinase n=1 Tax=Nocardia uniformis TaxID=53432 RepID=A0A849BYN4_9NOCA|nr:guanylate kinase [Nocardia uniformis]NNH71622.1 guanylate kinase [Nocardia uniformis]
MVAHTRKGRLVVLVGPSAVGKSTVVRCLRERLPELVFSVSATTRAPRPGEVDGRDYRFVTREQFDSMIEANELLEWADIHGGLQRSGTPAAPVREAITAGKPVLIEVDLEGARSIRTTMPEATLVFLAPPSWDELVSRLTSRGTESPEVIERRLQTAKTELAACDEFDIVIVNDEVTAACERLVSLFVSTNSRSASNPGSSAL